MAEKVAQQSLFEFLSGITLDSHEAIFVKALVSRDCSLSREGLDDAAGDKMEAVQDVLNAQGPLVRAVLVEIIKDESSFLLGHA